MTWTTGHLDTTGSSPACVQDAPAIDNPENARNSSPRTRSERLDEAPSIAGDVQPSSRPASSVETAWTALQHALEATVPPCRGDDRFVDDDVRPADVADVCDRCPILELCRDYAATSKPKGGVWAGRRWTRSTRKDTP